MSTIWRLASIIALFGLCVCNVPGATIYVDKANVGPEDGTSWATAWNTIAEGILDISNRNQVVQGGHLLWINSNTYNESVSIASNVAGTAADYNTFLANGPVTINNTSPFRPDASHIIIDGFNCIGNSGGAISPNSGFFSNSIVRNCSFTTVGTTEIRVSGFMLYSGFGNGLLVSNCIFRSLGCGMIVAGGNPKITIAHSIFYDVQGWGVDLHSVTAGAQLTVTNCIFAGVGSYAFYARDPDGKFEARNNLIWGSGSANVADDVAGNYYHTEAEINALNTSRLVFSNNIVANPGFADLANNWNFNCFYANSPCLKENSGWASNIGPFQSPVIIPVSNNTYYVKTDGNDGANGLSLGNAWATIGKATGVAGAGDTVRVQAGRYAESVLITRGGSGSTTVTYVADGAVTVDGAAYGIKVNWAAGAVLDGFSVTGCTVGVYLDESPGCTVQNCRLYGNTTAGLQMDYSPSCLLDNLHVFSNTSYGVYNSDGQPAGSKLSRSLVFDNFRGVYFGRFATGWLIENCNIYSNRESGVYVTYPMYAYYDVTFGGFPARIINCDIIGNNTNGIYVIYDTPTIRNCIIATNQAGVFEASAASDAYLGYNCFCDNVTNFVDEGTTARNTAAEINAVAGCSNNIVANPAFKNEFSGDFRLALGSPCLDAGDVYPGIETDLFGKARVRGGRVDIGSFEYWPPAGVIITGR